MLQIFWSISTSHLSITVICCRSSDPFLPHTCPSLSYAADLLIHFYLTLVHHCHMLQIFWSISISHLSITVICYRSSYPFLSLTCPSLSYVADLLIHFYHHHMLQIFWSISISHLSITVICCRSSDPFLSHTCPSLPYAADLLIHFYLTLVHHCHMLQIFLSISISHLSITIICCRSSDPFLSHTCPSLSYATDLLIHFYLYLSITVICCRSSDPFLSLSYAADLLIHFYLTLVHHCHMLQIFWSISISHLSITIICCRSSDPFLSHTCPSLSYAADLLIHFYLYLSITIICCRSSDPFLSHTCPSLSYAADLLIHFYLYLSITIICCRSSDPFLSHTCPSLSYAADLLIHFYLTLVHHYYMLQIFWSISISHLSITVICCRSSDPFLSLLVHHYHMLQIFWSISISHLSITVICCRSSDPFLSHTCPSLLYATDLLIHFYLYLSITIICCRSSYPFLSLTCPSLLYAADLLIHFYLSLVHHCHMLQIFLSISISHLPITIICCRSSYPFLSLTCPSLSYAADLLIHFYLTLVHHYHMLQIFWSISIFRLSITIICYRSSDPFLSLLSLL